MVVELERVDCCSQVEPSLFLFFCHFQVFKMLLILKELIFTTNITLLFSVKQKKFLSVSFVSFFCCHRVSSNVSNLKQLHFHFYNDSGEERRLSLLTGSMLFWVGVFSHQSFLKIPIPFIKAIDWLYPYFEWTFSQDNQFCKCFIQRYLYSVCSSILLEAPSFCR